MAKYPLSISRDACRDVTVGMIGVYIDGIKIHDFRIGSKIVAQLERGKHQIAFLAGKTEIKRASFFIGENGDGATITFFVKSNSRHPVIEIEFANSFIQITESTDEQKSGGDNDPGIGCLGYLVSFILILFGLILLIMGIIDIL